MKRRVLIKNMALAAVGLMFLPACETGTKKAAAQSLPVSLSSGQETLLAEVVDTIIPATDTPGAKELNVHFFVYNMVTDCYEQEVLESFVKGLDTVEDITQNNFGKSFGECNAAQRTEILGKLERSGKDDQKEFFALVKKLTIQGYMNSEYVMTNLTNYQMIPGHYYGCVPVKESKQAA
ncbi:gluconate 2-dehydrogenase subunit 3 family protein [Pontibacter silvestris]|uniref:Gluconate 2-dehydrogenase subunit 3 family protein n=1 Tax=Pontibacter silvestris TaxID=2305183 RepID=A0ABW4X3F9_9BACT|nr:gluconate 2-dehydrogenase subunit 3 family protein [Pontibacter silvestris]MCC9134816.1 gluconate 2-dehydrogenase subunit 3 family protein [Pontibacter silvestris]